MKNLMRFWIGVLGGHISPRLRNSASVKSEEPRTATPVRPGCNHRMSIRPYQQEALGCIEKSYKAGIHRQLVVAPTGTGKTVLFSQLPTVLQSLGLRGQTLASPNRWDNFRIGRLSGNLGARISRSARNGCTMASFLS